MRVGRLGRIVRTGSLALVLALVVGVVACTSEEAATSTPANPPDIDDGAAALVTGRVVGADDTDLGEQTLTRTVAAIPATQIEAAAGTAPPAQLATWAVSVDTTVPGAVTAEPDPDGDIALELVAGERYYVCLLTPSGDSLDGCDTIEVSDGLDIEVARGIGGVAVAER